MNDEQVVTERLTVYIETTEEDALKVLAEGFGDRTWMYFQKEGVWCEDRPRSGVRAAAGAGIGIVPHRGNVTLCMDIPPEVFQEYEDTESTRSLTMKEVERFDKDGTEPEGLEYQHMGFAIIPPAILNEHGRPQVYDHFYLGLSRKEMLDSIASWETQGGAQPKVAEMKAAVEFLDRVGWQTPLSLREPAPEDYAAPPPWFTVAGMEIVDGDKE